MSIIARADGPWVEVGDPEWGLRRTMSPNQARHLRMALDRAISEAETNYALQQEPPKPTTTVTKVQQP